MVEPQSSQERYRRDLAEQIANKQARRAKGRRQREHSAWYGLGIFGIVGWSVVIPMLSCLAVGIYIDAKWPGRISWTLILLVAGAVLGSLNAWYWVSRERKTIEKESEIE